VIAGLEQRDLLIDLLELVDRARGKPFLLRFLMKVISAGAAVV